MDTTMKNHPIPQILFALAICLTLNTACSDIVAPTLDSNDTDFTDTDTDTNTDPQLQIPSINVTEEPDAETYYKKASFKFSCDPGDSNDTCVLTCAIDGREISPCESPLEFTTLNPGKHELVITATNQNNRLSKSHSLKWSIVPPKWAELSAGAQHTCGILTDNTLWCWGNHLFGRTGVNPDTESTNVPMKVSGSWKSVSAGDQHTCAITTDNELFCWGFGGDGRLGNGTNQSASEPFPVTIKNTNSTNWLTVSAGIVHTCAITIGGDAYCWGSNVDGSIGVTGNDNDNYTTPQRVGNSSSWTAIAAGGRHTCGIQKNLAVNTLYCWGLYTGDNIWNQAHATPALLSVYKDSGIVSAGHAHTCVIDNRVLSKELVCFGSNNFNQLGDLDSVNAGKNWTTVSAGTQHTCAIKENKLFCWGNSMDTFRPPNGLAFHQVTVGYNHTCIIDSNQHAYCQGDGTYGQTGNGSNDPSDALKPVKWTN